MKLNANEYELKKIKCLFLTRENNIYLGDLYNEYLVENKLSINKTKVNSLIKTGISELKAFYQLMLKATKYQFSNDELFFAKKNIYPYTKKLDLNIYLSNSYYKKIVVPEIKYNDWELKYLNIKPYQGFVYTDLGIDIEEGFLERTHIGFFNQKFPFLAVIQNDTIWMSITPHEIETMNDSIALMKGNICVFGLGLGYYPYMCSIKDDVTSITIIEKDPRVIDLFNTHILPQFENRTKIKVICEDAFVFLANDKSKFDYNFIDLWHDVDDGLLLYLQSKKYENSHPNTIFTYWLEPAILAMLRRLILILLEEQLEGLDSIHYNEERNVYDKIINRLNFILEDYSIECYEDIKNLISDQSLKELTKLIY